MPTIDSAPIRVAVVDDSRSIRAWLKHVLNSDPRLTVVGEAAGGREARALLRHCDVDVMTLDVEMPGMTGLEFLSRLMVHRPMPVVMLSSRTEEGGEAAVQALALGAVDCIEKPRTALDPTIGPEICRRVYEAAHVQVHSLPQGCTQSRIRSPRRAGRAWSGDVILVGASTGGVAALEAFLTELDGCAVPVVIAQHMPEQFLRNFRQRLDEHYSRRFQLAQDGLVLEPGQGILAMGKTVSTHLDKCDNGSIICALRPPSCSAVYRPNIDDLFNSAVKSGLHGAAALLTGMGRDGAQGLLALRQSGFHTFAQNEASSVIYGMPKAAHELDAALSQGDPASIARDIGVLKLKKSILKTEMAQ